jgi:D-3-phosphoglycerate dehydrogenase / 2-oxoglutarate reductase
MTDILLTCPPMILQVEQFRARFDELGWQVHVPQFEQTMSENELIDLLPGFDGWIIGDDPASGRVVNAGVRGRLRAAVKWGVGVDNVDFPAFEAAGVPVANTPGMFGKEVADIALGYVIGLARHTFEIDRGVREGCWPKPAGISLAGKTAVVVGFGDIGRNTAKRLSACEMRVVVCDPVVDAAAALSAGCELGQWPDSLTDSDFVVFTCALTQSNRHMLSDRELSLCKPGVRVVNVARGPLIDEQALIAAQQQGRVGACALDVFEEEPLCAESPLRGFSGNIFGSHNASNTLDAVLRTSTTAIDRLSAFLEEVGPKG